MNSIFCSAGKRKGEVFPLVSKYTRYYRTRTITKTQMHFHHPDFKWLRQWCTIKASNGRANIFTLLSLYHHTLLWRQSDCLSASSEGSLRCIKRVMRIIENEWWKHTWDKKKKKNISVYRLKFMILSRLRGLSERPLYSNRFYPSVSVLTETSS